MKFDLLHEQVQKDIKLDRLNIDSECERIPNIFTKYLDIYRQEKKLLRQLQIEKDIVYKNKWLYYLGKADNEQYRDNPFDMKVLKQEVDIFINADEDYINIENKLQMSKEKVLYLEKVIKFIENMNFLIKSSMDYMKFINGT